MAVFHATIMAKSLFRTVPVTVILPTDKLYFPGMPAREEGKPYKTLYLLHGIPGDNTDWIYGTRVKRFAEENELCVVMPSGENGMYLDQPWAGTCYSEFIGQELVDFIRKTFPVSDKREDTYIGGLSMGGYGALYNGMKYSDTFGAVAAFSSALLVDETMPEEAPLQIFPTDRTEVKKALYGSDLEAAAKSDRNLYVMTEKKLAAGERFPDIFMTCGEDDFLREKNDAFAAFLKEKGVPVTYEVSPGNHEWDFWDRSLEKAMKWLPLEHGFESQSSGNVGR